MEDTYNIDGFLYVKEKIETLYQISVHEVCHISHIMILILIAVNGNNLHV